MNNVFISISDTLTNVDEDYPQARLLQVLNATLEYITHHIHHGLNLPYYQFSKKLSKQDWQQWGKTLDIYVSGTQEAQTLNLESRGKNYATNILSYPSELPHDVIALMGEIPLGELVLCHEVVKQQALEQQKTFETHLTHLVVHGILHLLGFDHELGHNEQEQMENFEIDILGGLGIGNPYLAQ